MEVILTAFFITSKSSCILHVCGGDPHQLTISIFISLYSPRMWRWSYQEVAARYADDVFSTYVEVILPDFLTSMVLARILHVCGGDPRFLYYPWGVFVYSPRMWRWSLHPTQKPVPVLVFSTYVEVILCFIGGIIMAGCILHVCGGDPETTLANREVFKYSPRMWRWSWLYRAEWCLYMVFSTYVEVILMPKLELLVRTSILHVCGGDPYGLSSTNCS